MNKEEELIDRLIDLAFAERSVPSFRPYYEGRSLHQ